MGLALSTIAAVTTLALLRGPAVAPPPGAAETAQVRRLSEVLPKASARPFIARASERFICLSDLPAAEAEAVMMTLERTASEVERFAASVGVMGRGRTERSVSVAFADRAAFERFAREVDRIDAGWMAGYWIPGADRTVFRRSAAVSTAGPASRSVGSAPRVDEERSALAANGFSNDDDTATVAHEAAHQLLHRIGVQRRSLDGPLYLAEGLAINFESADAFANQPVRTARLARQIADGATPPLAVLVSTSRLLSGEPADVERFYDLSWSLVRFLRETQPDAFAAYLRSLRTEAGRLGAAENRAIFERHFGAIAELEAAWRRSVAAPNGDSFDRLRR
jgi:hypothetical protein